MLGPAFRLLKGTRSNYAELEYDFEECYKALSEKLDWENLKGGDYLFDLTKPLPLVMIGNRQKVPVHYFFNNDLKYLQGGFLTVTYTTSITKTKGAQYDLPGIEDMVPNIWVPVKVAYDKHALWGISHWREQLTQVEVMRKHAYGYLKEIAVRRADNDLYTLKEGDFPRLRINDIEDMLFLNVHQKLGYLEASQRSSTRSQKLPEEDQHNITNNIRIEYLPKRRWSTLEKKRANIMIKVIDKQLKERRMVRSLEKFAVEGTTELTSGYFNEQYDFVILCSSS
ncbi:hypothetical protein Tco_1465564 [Tanacetum coccineum]